MTELSALIRTRWTRKQWEVISWRAPLDDGRPQVEIAGILGEYGGGKTTPGAARCLLVARENPYVDGVHKEDDPPTTLIVGPSLSAVIEGPFTRLMEICPPELIQRRRLWGVHQDITLSNGHRIALKAARAAVEGGSVCQLWADDLQHRSYSKGIWHNLQARVRDGRAQRLNCQGSGLALRGTWIADVFGPGRAKKRGEARRTWLFRTTDNPYLARGVVDALLDSLAADELAIDAEGWSPPRDRVHPSWSERLHLARAPDLSTRHAIPTHIGVDLRRHAAVAFVQDEIVRCRSVIGDLLDESGLLVVGQMIVEHMSAADICERIRVETPWTFEPGVSTIGMDPTASPDEVSAFARHFPGCRIVQYTSGPYWRNETGKRAVNRALLDGRGNVRLHVHPSLVGQSERGIPEALQGYSWMRLKDDKFEHADDALRYIAQVRLPIPDMRGTEMDVRPRVNVRPGWSAE